MNDYYALSYEEKGTRYANEALAWGYKSAMFAWVPFLSLYFGIRGFSNYFKAVRCGVKSSTTKYAAIYSFVGIFFIPFLIFIYRTMGMLAVNNSHYATYVVDHHGIPLVDGSYATYSDLVNNVQEAQRMQYDEFSNEFLIIHFMSTFFL